MRSVMDFILACLLYLAVITSPNTYYDYEIEQYKQDNQASIDAISQNPTLSEQILNDYADEVDEVVIIDQWED